MEDACEAHLGEWKGRKAGTFGDLGCFSFQTAKALTCGEGGAILGRDADLIDLCYSFHNLGRPHGRMPRDRGNHPIVAGKCRMAEYQASILLTQMQTVVEETKLRDYVGVYRVDEKRTITVTLEGGRLFTQPSGGGKREALPMSEGEFSYEGSVDRVRFERDGAGKVLGLVRQGFGSTPEKCARTAQAPVERKEVRLSPEQLDRCVGRFELMPGLRAVVRR